MITGAANRFRLGFLAVALAAAACPMEDLMRFAIGSEVAVKRWNAELRGHPEQ